MAQTIARLEQVRHQYGDVVALDGVSVEIRQGEVLAVLGPNGAGKTTAVSLLLGTLTVQSGVAEVFGQTPGSQAVRARRGAMLQISGVAETLTVREHISLFRSYYARSLGEQRLLSMAGLEELADRRFGKLSGGQQQRVMFALALAGDPELVFLDEPTTGLDLEARRRLWHEIRQLRAMGRSAVLTTHHLEEADALADRVVVIHRGRVIAEGTPAQIKSRSAGRRISCITEIPLERLSMIPGVARAAHNGQHTEILSSAPEEVLRTLLEMDRSLRDLHVSGAGLEDAFIALTQTENEEAA
ncbi:MAG: ABC transporter ATP-binding protein [Xanthomonadales bacterium]|nr:ABC transporter ATP-binding protein [Xanthomonadales bacterium]